MKFSSLKLQRLNVRWSTINVNWENLRQWKLLGGPTIPTIWKNISFYPKMQSSTHCQNFNAQRKLTTCNPHHRKLRFYFTFYAKPVWFYGTVVLPQEKFSILFYFLPCLKKRNIEPYHHFDQRQINESRIPPLHTGKHLFQ